MQLTDLFNLSLVGRRNEPGLEFEDAAGHVETYTFGELDVRANRMARALAARGLVAGDRLAVQLPNSVHFLDLFLASLRVGLIFVPINVLYREREIAHIVSDASPAMSVFPGDMAQLAAEAESHGLKPVRSEHSEWKPRDPSEWIRRDSSEWIRRDSSEWSRRDSSEWIRRDSSEWSRRDSSEWSPRASARGDGDAPAALVYTSGTTGRSKGAVLSHNNFAANAVNIVSAWAITSQDRYFAALPLFHVHGLANGVMSWLVSGCRMRLVERFDASRIAAQLDAFQPTLFFGVPTMYVRLLEMEGDVATRIGARARLFVSGSAPLPAAVLGSFREKFGHTILERYGMSETLMNISNPYVGERRAGSVGLPLPGVSVRIVDPAGVPVGDEAIGQVELRGSNVFAGYWNNPDATRAAVRDGWFRTGDLGERSADGYYTLRGRSSDLIISGGFNIYPREIEEVLLEHPGVREAVVVGAPDPRRGEVPVAYLVTDDPVDAGSLRDACAKQLASFKVPRGFVRVDALPRTALGKVQKHLLPPWESA